jgi:hypothetical protein
LLFPPPAWLTPGENPTGHESITQSRQVLATLPGQITHLETSIERLRSAHPAPSSPARASLALPLPATLDLLASRTAELAHLSHQLDMLEGTLPRRTRELEGLQAELRPLESRKLGSVAGAREAKRRKEEGAGGVGDDLEERGRWWRGVEAGLRELLDVDGRQEALAT